MGRCKRVVQTDAVAQTQIRPEQYFESGKICGRTLTKTRRVFDAHATINANGSKTLRVSIVFFWRNHGLVRKKGTGTRRGKGERFAMSNLRWRFVLATRSAVKHGACNVFQRRLGERQRDVRHLRVLRIHLLVFADEANVIGK